MPWPISARTRVPAATTESSPLHPYLLPRKGHDFASKLKADSIFEVTQHHISYTLNGNALNGLEKYNDSTPYGCPENVERSLLRREVDRLVQFASSNEAILFESNSELGPNVKNAMEDIASLADQMKCAMGIIRLDNARISLQHCKIGIEETLHNFRHARLRLMGRFNTDQSHVLTPGPKRLEPLARNERLFHTFVDYVTASVARLLVRSAVSEYWGEQTLSCLAAFTTKLKLLSADPSKFANSSIATAEAALEELANTSKEEMLIPIRLKPDDAAKDVSGLETESDVSSKYHAEKTIFNQMIWSLLRRVLYDLLLPETRKASASCFQIHTTAYQAGLDGTPTTLSSDRLGEISASADPFCVKNAYTALELVVKNLKAIQARRQQSRPAPPATGAEMGLASTGGHIEATMIEYEWANAELGSDPLFGKLKTDDPDEIFSIVIPLTLSSTFAAMNLAPLIAIAGSETIDEDPIFQFESPPRAFRALMTVSTADFQAKERSPEIQKYRAKDITTLPHSPIRFGVRGRHLFSKLNINVLMPI